MNKLVAILRLVLAEHYVLLTPKTVDVSIPKSYENLMLMKDIAERFSDKQFAEGK